MRDIANVTGSRTERGSSNGTGKDEREIEKGIGTKRETESVTERRADLWETWSTPPSGDQVWIRFKSHLELNAKCHVSNTPVVGVDYIICVYVS